MLDLLQSSDKLGVFLRIISYYLNRPPEQTRVIYGCIELSDAQIDRSLDFAPSSQDGICLLHKNDEAFILKQPWDLFTIDLYPDRPILFFFLSVDVNKLYLR